MIRCFLLLCFAFPVCLAQAVVPNAIHFSDIGPSAGMKMTGHASPDRQYLVETMGGGIALFDCDNDGKLDIVVVNDSTIDRYRHGGDLMVTLYRQEGNLHFTDVTQSAGLLTKGWGMGIAIGDYDNDGLPDIYVTGYGHNVLYHNLGGCKFEDVTKKAGVGGSGFSVGAAWADYDHDGHLDLFVDRYVHSDINHLPKPGTPNLNYKGLPIEVPGTEGETAFLFHNRGDGTFEDVAAKAGVSNSDKRRGMGVTWGDYDNDGWPDLFVANDMGPNYLYHNKHDGTFEDVGMISGTALDSSGLEMGNMAGDFGDYDHDGKLDLLVSRFGNQPESLYHNDGQGQFSDKTWQAKIGSLSSPYVKWGTGFADFDNDGWPDVFIANGNVTEKVNQLPHEAKYREPIQLFRNLENGTFQEIANQTGLNAGALQSRRGTAFGDLNNDGRIDVVAYNVDGPPSVFLNETHNNNHAVLFRLIGTKSNRAAIGARVTVTAGSMIQMEEVGGGGSYLSTNDQRLHFGLAAASTITKVEIRWPSGATENLTKLPADMLYTIEEGKGITAKAPLAKPAAPRSARK